MGNFICTLWNYFIFTLVFLPIKGFSYEDKIMSIVNDTSISLIPVGGKNSEWTFQFSRDLRDWENIPALSPVFSGEESSAPVNFSKWGPIGFFRTMQTEGFYDPKYVRTIELTFEDDNWASQLASNYATGEEIPGMLKFGDETIQGVGIRYKGNTSYQRSGEKKSINISVDKTVVDADLKGYDTLNFNNANMDQTLLKEVLYFNTFKKYVACPGAGFAQLNINGENWGVYSNVQQQDGSLIRQYFGENSGDRWKAPSGRGSGAGDNSGPGGGGPPGGPGGGRPPGGPGGGGPGGAGQWESGDRALLYLGDDSATYENLYELKKQKTDNPWEILINATDVLNNSPDEDFQNSVEKVMAVDSWLWFLVLENVFTDDDSYWHKGCDYMIYYEPESGRIYPIEHDGNEAFSARDVRLDPLEGEDNPNRPVISKLLAVPELRQRYIAHMRTILEREFNPENLNVLIDQYVKTIEAYVEEDPKKDFTMASFRSGITSLKNLIKTRHTYLGSHTELSKAPPSISSVSIPTVPMNDKKTVIHAQVEGFGDEGIDSVHLYYRSGSTGSYLKSEMLDDGNHDDLEAGNGVYGASIPPFLAGDKVRYYVEARSDNFSKTSVFYPATAESDPSVYRVKSKNTDQDSPVIINEFMASNKVTLPDPQGEFDDWIELHNTTDNEVNISGWYLSDNPDNPRKWVFPEGSVIAANSFLIVWADEDGKAPEGLHANFKLSSYGESVLLSSSDETMNLIMDHIQFGSQETDVSYGRLSTKPNVFEEMIPSPGKPNP